MFTTITKEGLPLVRYRTRDLTSLNYQACGCGRTLVRMKKCTGRSDDMMIIRGVNILLRVGADVKLVEHKTIERSEGKAKRVIDKRKLS